MQADTVFSSSIYKLVAFIKLSLWVDILAERSEVPLVLFIPGFYIILTADVDPIRATSDVNFIYQIFVNKY